MELPPEVASALAIFNNEFPAYTAEVTRILSEVQKRQVLFGFRIKEATRMSKSGDPETSNDVAATEFGDLAAFQNEWLVRYTHGMGQMLDKLREIMEKLHAYGSVYSGGLWTALKLDGTIEIQNSVLSGIRGFRDVLKELSFNDELEQRNLDGAIAAHDRTIQSIGYYIDFLNRLRIDAFAE